MLTIEQWGILALLILLGAGLKWLTAAHEDVSSGKERGIRSIRIYWADGTVTEHAEHMLSTPKEATDGS